MLLFCVYLMVACLTAGMNQDKRKRGVCCVCALALVAGLAMDSVVTSVDPLMGYFLVSSMNAVALCFIPLTRHYWPIHWLFVGGLFLCVSGSLKLYYNLADNVPYEVTTHALNIAQSIILVVASDRALRGPEPSNTTCRDYH